MDRATSLEYLQGYAQPIYKTAQRAFTDTPDGVGPAIDEAVRLIAGEGASLQTYTILAIDTSAFRAALRYYALDLVEWHLLPYADNQVDSPLTNVKLSQVVKNVQTKKLQALSDLTNLGYGPTTVHWIHWAFDYLEPKPGVVGSEHV